MNAVLVMDMPESCDKCPVMFRNEEERCCMVEGRNSFTKKPSWCPLKPMPDKRYYPPTRLCLDAYENGERSGWNNCIDVIVGDD